MTTKTRIEVRPMTGALGAEIFGVDIARMDDATFDEIYAAWLEHLVVFFRDQDITPEQQLAFAHRFGEIHTHPYMKGLDDYPEILEIVKEPKDTYTFGNVWHTDQMFTPKPAKATILYAKETPSAGGDTMFANMYMAYETLSEGMRNMLDGMVGISSSAKARVTQTRRDRMKTSAKVSGAMELEAEHPVVRTHPETGRKALYVNYGHTVRFKDMTEAESTPLLNFLYAHQSRPEFTCCFRWQPGSIAFWDNRCTQHNPVNDYHGFKRTMHRITIAGDRPT